MEPLPSCSLCHLPYSFFFMHGLMCHHLITGWATVKIMHEELEIHHQYSFSGVYHNESNRIDVLNLSLRHGNRYSTGGDWKHIVHRWQLHGRHCKGIYWEFGHSFREHRCGHTWLSKNGFCIRHWRIFFQWVPRTISTCTSVISELIH